MNTETWVTARDVVQPALVQRRIAIRPLVGEVGRLGRKLTQRLALGTAVIGTVAIQAGLFSVQQIGKLLAVMNIGRRHARTVHQPRLAIDSDAPYTIQTHVLVKGIHR